MARRLVGIIAGAGGDHVYVCMYIYIYVYIYMVPPPLTYPFVSFETQGWVGAGGSGTERRPENAKN